MNDGNRLAALRDREGLSLAGLADFCGVGQRTVERWESGTTGIPDSHKRTLAARFDTTVEGLMGWDRTEAAA